MSPSIIPSVPFLSIKPHIHSLIYLFYLQLFYLHVRSRPSLRSSILKKLFFPFSGISSLSSSSFTISLFLSCPPVFLPSPFSFSFLCPSCHLLVAVPFHTIYSQGNASPCQPPRALSHPCCPQPRCLRWAQMWQWCPVVLKAAGGKFFRGCVSVCLCPLQFVHCCSWL